MDLNSFFRKTLNPKSPGRASCILNSVRGGFTMIEMMVVLAITALLTGLLVIYNHSGEQQILVFKDQAVIIGSVLKAKSLALQGFNMGPGSNICGYGIHFNPAANNYVIFKEIANPCSSGDRIYSGTSEDVEVHNLSAGLKFVTPSLDILFIPPDPKMIFTPAISPPQNSTNVKITSTDGTASALININTFGQVTAK